MEESLSLLKRIEDEFSCGPVDIRTYSPLALAYIGDGIYEIIVRTVVVRRGNRPAQKLHRAATKLVNAGMQAAMAKAIQEDLTEEEKSVYLRGRNAKSYTSAKNASIEDYRKATGLEALFGYLYLSDRTDRIIELIKAALEHVNIEL